MDGIFGLALSPRAGDVNNNNVWGPVNRNDERQLYFHALASRYEHSVSLKIVNNATIWEADSEALPRAFKKLGSRGIQTPGRRMF